MKINDVFFIAEKAAIANPTHKTTRLCENNECQNSKYFNDQSYKSENNTMVYNLVCYNIIVDLMVNVRYPCLHNSFMHVHNRTRLNLYLILVNIFRPDTSKI